MTIPSRWLEAVDQWCSSDITGLINTIRGDFSETSMEAQSEESSESASIDLRIVRTANMAPPVERDAEERRVTREQPRQGLWRRLRTSFDRCNPFARPSMGPRIVITPPTETRIDQPPVTSVPDDSNESQIEDARIEEEQEDENANDGEQKEQGDHTEEEKDREQENDKKQKEDEHREGSGDKTEDTKDEQGDKNAKEEVDDKLTVGSGTPREGNALSAPGQYGEYTLSTSPHHSDLFNRCSPDDVKKQKDDTPNWLDIIRDDTETSHPFHGFAF